MIGDARFTYATKDVVALVRKDIINKFGQRDLANIDFAVPDVITTKAKVTSFPNPEITKISVEDQIKALGLPTKPDIPRSDGSVGRDAASIGGENLIFSFNRAKNLLTIAGGPVLWSPSGTLNLTPAGHWVGVKIGFPLGWTTHLGQIVPYTLNGTPKFVPVDEVVLENSAITLYFDAAMTTNDLVIGWDDKYNPEKLSVVIDASLQDSAVRKIPALPKEPQFHFEFPIEEQYIPANIQVNVDLSLGK